LRWGDAGGFDQPRSREELLAQMEKRAGPEGGKMLEKILVR
jgi:hypothetical protein